MAAVAVAWSRRSVRDAPRPAVPPPGRLLALALVPLALALVVTGAFVTAAGPHSGGADIGRLGDLEDAVYVHVRVTAAFGIAFLALLVGALYGTGDRLRASVVASSVLVLLVQMVVGEMQWREQLPWWLVLLHVTLATLVWTGVVALAALLRTRPAARAPP